MLKKVLHIFFVFNLLFAPAMPIIRDGCFLSIVLGLGYICLNSRIHIYLTSFIKNKYVIFVFAIPIIVISIIFVQTAIHLYMDTEILRRYILVLASSISTIIVFFILWFDGGRDVNYVLDSIVSACSIQTVIILIAFINVDFREVVQSFQSREMIARADSYGGIRTLMLSTRVYFTLGASYGFAFILLMKKILFQDKVSMLDITKAFLLIIGIMFIARTGFVGVGIGIMYILVKKANVSRQLLAKSLFTFIIIINVSIVLFPNLVTSIEEIVVPFAFEMFMSDKIETDSTNSLLKMWSVDFDTSTILIGDGRWSTLGGAYYGGSDVGYIRNIYYGGFLYMLTIILLLSLLLYKVCKLAHEDTFFYLVVLLYSLLLHAKGDIIIGNECYYSFMTLPLLSLYFFYKEKCYVRK